MKRYILYITVLTVVTISIGIYFVRSNDNNGLGTTTSIIEESDTAPVAQSHRNYDVKITSDTGNIKPGQSTKITYKIIDDKKEIVKDFRIAHEKLMHFILVRKDLQNFQHLHPNFNQQTGEFAVDVTFPTDGPYRLFPDFTPALDNPMQLPVTVSYDVNVGSADKYKAQAVTADLGIVKKTGIYSIDYYFPEPPIKSKTQIDYNLSVGQPDELVILEPYLGAMGHGVIIKEGTLDFIHTHAGGMDTGAMENMTAAEHAAHQAEPDSMEFSTTFPEPGIYRIFTQFQVKGKVITSDYTLKVN